MGRPSKFDRDSALRSATEIFWKRGYVNTSLVQLLQAMKLGEGSFYNAFKSKKRLYLECLEHYNATFMARRGQALGAERTTRERVRDFFDVVIEDFTRNESPGCLPAGSTCTGTRRRIGCGGAPSWWLRSRPPSRRENPR